MRAGTTKDIGRFYLLQVVQCLENKNCQQIRSGHIVKTATPAAISHHLMTPAKDPILSLIYPTPPSPTILLPQSLLTPSQHLQIVRQDRIALHTQPLLPSLAHRRAMICHQRINSYDRAIQISFFTLYIPDASQRPRHENTTPLQVSRQ